MKRMGRSLAIVLALAAGLGVSVLRATAAQDTDVMHMAMRAKTPADHAKLAAEYDREAAAARAKAETHRNMAEEFRKAGGYLIDKLHYDEHCEALVKSFTAAAEEYTALAAAEREMAKPAK
jgi:hypothetical protein